MANGNTDLIREMKKIIEDGKPLDIETRDRLLFSAVIDIYEKIEAFRPVLIFYQISLYFASAIGLGLLGIIGAVLTGQVELIFK